MRCGFTFSNQQIPTAGKWLRKKSSTTVLSFRLIKRKLEISNMMSRTMNFFLKQCKAYGHFSSSSTELNLRTRLSGAILESPDAILQMALGEILWRACRRVDPQTAPRFITEFQSCWPEGLAQIKVGQEPRSTVLTYFRDRRSLLNSLIPPLSRLFRHGILRKIDSL